jgi:hypothetical protein
VHRVEDHRSSAVKLDGKSRHQHFNRYEIH